MKKRARNQAGFIVTLEIIFIATIMVAAVIIGWTSLAHKVVGEMGDVGDAVGSLNQSYTITGWAVGHPTDPIHPTDVASHAGSQYVDDVDFCDDPNNPTVDCGVRVCQPPLPEGP